MFCPPHHFFLARSVRFNFSFLFQGDTEVVTSRAI
jgi:hypothetical protein